MNLHTPSIRVFAKWLSFVVWKLVPEAYYDYIFFLLYKPLQCPFVLFVVSISQHKPKREINEKKSKNFCFQTRLRKRHVMQSYNSLVPPSPFFLQLKIKEKQGYIYANAAKHQNPPKACMSTG